MRRRCGLWKTDNVRRGVAWVLPLVLLSFVALGCNLELADKNACTPQCNGNYCQDDGCRGICGCPGDDVCDDQGQCVPLTGCSGTCGDRECGQVCGEVCGTGACEPGFKCVAGFCECRPSCDGTHCGDDGCGDTCSCDSGDYCDPDTKQCVSECVPKECDGLRCDDGCGGECACADGTVCSPSGECVAECDNTCQSEGWGCGELCGVSCGECADNELCIDHRCECQPKCDGTSCEDGCGGECDCPEGTQCNVSGQCVEQCLDTCESTGWKCGDVCGESCGECGEGYECVEGSCLVSTLSLEVDKSELDGNLRTVTLKVTYTPRQDEARPRMADLRIDMEPFADPVIETVTPGNAVSGKQLFIDPLTLKNWRVRPDGSVQFLILPGDDPDTTFKSGENGSEVLWVTLSYEVEQDGTNGTSTPPVHEFSLVRRFQTFAPYEADFALQDSAYDTPVKVPHE